jgi:hypothetical protein
VEGTRAIDGGEGNVDQIGPPSSFHLPYELFPAFQENVQVTKICIFKILVGGSERQEKNFMGSMG